MRGEEMRDSVTPTATRVGWGGMGIAAQMSHLIFSYAIHFFVTFLCTNII